MRSHLALDVRPAHLRREVAELIVSGGDGAMEGFAHHREEEGKEWERGEGP